MAESTSKTQTQTQTQQNIESARNDIQNLLKMLKLRTKECDDMENETRYLKEYVASFISMGELKK